MLSSDNKHNPHPSTPGGLGGALSNSIPSQLSISSVVNEIKDKFKNDDEENTLPFQGLDKAAVLQETKIFSDANMVTRQPRKYCQLITKLLHILTHDEPFTSTETTEVFFGVTKLFQSKDSNLRRMVYLFIKEVAEATSADEVIIVTQSLTKDMNSDVDLYRANSIRVLCRIIDGAMLSAIERYIKQAIVDKNPFVASSALVAGLQLIRNNGDIIRRWINEVQETLNSTNDMVQYHAIMLYYSIRQIDKLAISKFVMQLQKQNLRSPLAYCLVIRYTSRLLAEDMMSPNSRTFYLYLESMLRHKSEIVIYEAAKAICSLPIDAADLSPAISVLQLFLSSPKPVLRFCACRCLNQVAQIQPLVVTKCNEDMESLISDSNRSTATLAITTLLKTGSESSIERLMKQITTFMSEIADEFKIIVVDAIRNLCLKYPSKYRVLYNFLANFLREEGGFELKRSITDSILFLIDRIPESKDNGLLHLCEFIEDCEFTQLSVKILHVLGEKGVSTASPGRFVRFIYNRVILENAIIRSSAISALANYAIAIESLRSSVITLLRRCLYDDDDEVRDRATLYLAIVESHNTGETILDKPPRHAKEILKSLDCYQQSSSEGALSFDTLPYIEIKEEPKKPTAMTEASDNMGGISSSSSLPNNDDSNEDPSVELYKIPEIASLGQLFRSSHAVNLTEEETEYVVKCTKHIFANHVVLQFTILNTVKEQMLKNVSVQVDLNNDPAYNLEFVVPVEKATFGKAQNCYVCLRRNPEAGFPVSKLLNEMKFEVFELDSSGEPEDEGFDENYPLEPLEISCADYVARYPVSDFRAAWEQLNQIPEVREQYALQYKNVVEGVAGVIANLGLTPCENTGTVTGGVNARAHIMLLSGAFLGGYKILVKAKVAVDANNTMILQMAVRSQNQAISQIIADSIR